MLFVWPKPTKELIKNSFLIFNPISFDKIELKILNPDFFELRIKFLTFNCKCSN